MTTCQAMTDALGYLPWVLVIAEIVNLGIIVLVARAVRRTPVHTNGSGA